MASDSTLGSMDFGNGSLATQIVDHNTTDSYYSWYNSLYPMTLNSTYPSINIHNNNITSITWNASDFYSYLMLPLLQTMTDEGMYKVGVPCLYPISGQYDVLPRGLYYILLIISLFFRRHNWLAAAALGTAMTYAATTAIHMIALAFWFKFGNNEELINYNPNTSRPYGDVDVFGIYPVLSAAAIMVTPILNWSVSIRNNRAQPVVIWWAILILAALVPAWLWFNPTREGDLTWMLQEPVTFGLCPKSLQDQYPECNENMPLDETLYNKCQCFDFCSTFQPPTPMRSGAGMVPFLSRSMSDTSFSNNKYLGAVQFGRFAIAFIFLQGILGILENQFTQAECRNLIFRFLYLAPKDYILLLLKGKRKKRWLERFNMGPANQDTDKSTFGWKIRKQIARFLAAAMYSLAILMAIICPAVFIITVVTNELFVGYFPVSEHSDAVGAWSSWVSVALIGLAGAGVRYREAWEDSLAGTVYAIWTWLAYDADDDDKPQHPKSKNNEQSLKNMFEPTSTLSAKKSAFVAEVEAPFIHLWHNLHVGRRRISIELIMFKKWWHNPEAESRRNWESLLNETEERLQVVPKCTCRFCYRHRFDDANRKRYSATWGQRLVSGLEKSYSVHKAASRSTTFKLDENPMPEITEMSPKAFGSPISPGSPGSEQYNQLPSIHTVTPLRFDTELDEQQDDIFPAEPPPARGRDGYYSLPRIHQRSDSQQLEMSDFRIPRKSIHSPKGSSTEYRGLLGNDLSP